MPPQRSSPPKQRGGFSVSPERARRLLCALGDHLRETLIRARRRGSARLASVAGVTAADTIYRIDRISEAAIVGWFERHWPKAWPVQVVMEGVEDEAPLTFPTDVPVRQTRLKCILDPIDGTRNLMYDKRPAWALAGLAPQRGTKTELRDIFVAVMTELPTANQGIAQQWSAIRGAKRRDAASTGKRRPGASPAGRVIGVATDLRTGARRRVAARPSKAEDCRHGFASLVKFFPEGKELTARIEERLWTELYGAETAGGKSPVVFDDQYTTTGGQLFEILSGHDRMVGDLRPLIHRRLGIASALVCHPYDLCTALVLEQAGGVVEHPLGGPVRAPLDTTFPVSWIGYANRRLAARIRPVLRRILRQENIH